MKIVNGFILSTALFSFMMSNAVAQVQLLWTSPSTVGEKRPLYEINLFSVRYYYLIDTSAHQCKLYNSDNFTLAYTITGVGAYDFPICRLNDMNSNGHSEVFFLTNGSARILDASTSAVIYAWPSSYQYYGLSTTTGNNTIDAYFRTSSSGSYSFVVYSLGITTSALDGNDNSTLPSRMTLEQNFPNPFNPRTVIEYSIPHADHVSVEIYDVTGRLVKTLVSGRQEAGPHFTSWDGTGNAASIVSSGTYFSVVRIGNDIQSRKMIFLK